MNLKQHAIFPEPIVDVSGVGAEAGSGAGPGAESGAVSGAGPGAGSGAVLV